MKLAFVFAEGRLGRLAAARKGEAPTEFFYGAIELERAGDDITSFEVPPLAPITLGNRLGNLALQWNLSPPKMDGHVLAQTYRLCAELNRFECILATGGNIGFALAFWKRRGILRTPIVTIQCGVLNFPQNALRRRVTKWLLEEMHSVVFGDAEFLPMKETYGLSDARLSVNQFGVDTDFWQPVAQEGDIVLSVGNDGRRDYETLLKAAPEIPQEIHIVTRLSLPSSLPPNVKHHSSSWKNQTLTDTDLRDLYHRARCVVVPLKPSLQPSGQSVALQAMACARPVILTKTIGLWNPAELKDGANVLFIDPERADQLAGQVNKLGMQPERSATLSKEGREHAVRHGNIRDFASRLKDRCIDLVRAHGGNS